jgi:hypothetical protein
MSERNDGGPAFPAMWRNQVADKGLCGMSLRDYFAAAIAQGIYSGQVMSIIDDESKKFGLSAEAFIAQASYQQADAMIKARATGDKSGTESKT